MLSRFFCKSFSAIEYQTYRNYHPSKKKIRQSASYHFSFLQIIRETQLKQQQQHHHYIYIIYYSVLNEPCFIQFCLSPICSPHWSWLELLVSNSERVFLWFKVENQTTPRPARPHRAWLPHIFSTTCSTITLIRCFNHNGFLSVLCLPWALLLRDLLAKNCFWFLHVGRNLAYVLPLSNCYFYVDLISALVSQKYLPFSLTLIWSSASWILLYYYWSSRVNFIFLHTYYSYH